ncbi:hypothetical protein XF14_00685 [Burkholderia gladioli]|nr:hypothetical protein XF14_00685 [Burkholderia gladioli]
MGATQRLGGSAADIAGATDASDEADKAHEPGPWPRPAKRRPEPAPVALRLHDQCTILRIRAPAR